MINEQDIRDRLYIEKADMDKLLKLSNESENKDLSGAYLNMRSKVYERVIALEWVLGIRKSIDD